jgi:hypothetical protein
LSSAAASDALHDFHIVDVERTYGVTAFVSLRKHFLGVDKRHDMSVLSMRSPEGEKYTVLGVVINTIRYILHDMRTIGNPRAFVCMLSN